MFVIFTPSLPVLLGVSLFGNVSERGNIYIFYVWIFMTNVPVFWAEGNGREGKGRDGKGREHRASHSRILVSNHTYKSVNGESSCFYFIK